LEKSDIDGDSIQKSDDEPDYMLKVEYPAQLTKEYLAILFMPKRMLGNYYLKINIS